MPLFAEAIRKEWRMVKMNENLTLRTLEKTDLEFIHALYNNPEIISYWFEEPYLSFAHREDSFDKNMDNQRHRQFILMNIDEKVGFVELVSIDPRHRNAEFTIIIHPDFQGKGYAYTATRLAMDYAFSVINLHKLYLYVDTTNEKAIHIYEKAGFQMEGVTQEMFFVNGTYHDAAVMCIFDRDYWKMHE